MLGCCCHPLSRGQGRGAPLAASCACAAADTGPAVSCTSQPTHWRWKQRRGYKDCRSFQGLLWGIKEQLRAALPLGLPAEIGPVPVAYCCGRRGSGGPGAPGPGTAVGLRCFEPCQYLLFLLPPRPVSSSDRAGRGQSSPGTGVWAQRQDGRVTPRDTRSAAQRDPRGPQGPLESIAGRGGSRQVTGRAGRCAGQASGKVPVTAGQG